MKYGLLIFSFLLSLPILAKENADSLDIVQLLMEDYQTMQNHDIKKHMGFCAPDYIFIENGEIWKQTVT